MAVQERSIIVSTSSIGMGNPATAEALHNRLSYAYPEQNVSLRILNSPTVRFAQVGQSLMTHLATEIYTKNDQALRTSWPAQIAASEMYKELIQGSGIEANRRVGVRTLFAVQEHQLLPFMERPELIKAYFDKIYLFIPDVFPKESAMEVLKKLHGHVQAVVWNKAAHQKLWEQGITTHLVRPVLPTLAVSQLKEKPQVAIIKESGTGMAAQAQRELHKRYLEKYGGVETMTSHATIVRSQSNERITSSSRLEHYNYLTSVAARAIGTYPSEMVMVLANMLAQGWSGNIDLVAPRGKHEQANLAWLTQQVQTITTQDGITSIPRGAITREQMITKIGQKPLTQIGLHD